MEDKLVTQTELAEILDVKQPMVHKYIKQGKIPESCIVKVGRYNKIKLNAAIKALEKNLDPSRTKRKSETDPKVIEAGFDPKASFAEAQRLNEQYKAALKKLEYDERMGKLVNADEVREAAFNKGRRVRDAILNIPDRISANLAAESDPIAVSKLLTAELIQTLEELC